MDNYFRWIFSFKLFDRILAYSRCFFFSPIFLIFGARKNMITYNKESLQFSTPTILWWTKTKFNLEAVLVRDMRIHFLFSLDQVIEWMTNRFVEEFRSLKGHIQMLKNIHQIAVISITYQAKVAMTGKTLIILEYKFIFIIIFLH